MKHDSIIVHFTMDLFIITFSNQTDINTWEIHQRIVDFKYLFILMLFKKWHETIWDSEFFQIFWFYFSDPQWIAFLRLQEQQNLWYQIFIRLFWLTFTDSFLSYLIKYFALKWCTRLFWKYRIYIFGVKFLLIHPMSTI